MSDEDKKPAESAPPQPPTDPKEYADWINDKLRQAVDALIARNICRGYEPGRAVPIGDPPVTSAGDPGAIDPDAEKAPPSGEETC
jgi:hypothetical protein